MRLFSAFTTLAVLLAAVTAQDDVISEPCPGTMRRLAAFKDKGCECQTKTFIATDGGTMCADMAPDNSIATCVNIGTSKSKCDYKCKDGYKRADKGGCVKDEPPPSKYPSIAPPCPSPMVVSYASPGNPCGCATSIKTATKRDPAAVECSKLIHCLLERMRRVDLIPDAFVHVLQSRPRTVSPRARIPGPNRQSARSSAIKDSSPRWTRRAASPRRRIPPSLRWIAARRRGASVSSRPTRCWGVSARRR
ncbi:hypothetical protein GGX14DRAFT_454030 [Mycena pura]|uniref:Uncharacterized protein n=1 Tax=Mycena pura TaxID=153505 RepID=A0AAD6YCA5_9AGAR|nr:hypothetical protein GGX14DRAFT_454030 [Mycena pura]